MRVCDCLHVIARYIHILEKKEKKYIIELDEEIHVKRRQVDDFSMYKTDGGKNNAFVFFFFFY